MAASTQACLWQTWSGAALDIDLNAAITIANRVLETLAGVGLWERKMHAVLVLDSSGRSASKREHMAEERLPSKLRHTAAVW